MYCVLESDFYKPCIQVLSSSAIICVRMHVHVSILRIDQLYVAS